MSAIPAASVSLKTMADQRFGKLVAIEPAGRLKNGDDLWLCRCDCGEVQTKRGSSLRRGATKSCGCMQTAGMRAARLKSGARRSDDPELRKFYSAWAGMRARCRNPNHKDFKYYGAIGIDVCERWNSFEAFKEDMWPRPEGMTLDRKDPHKGYCPDNCRWATHMEQRHNRRSA